MRAAARATARAVTPAAAGEVAKTTLRAATQVRRLAASQQVVKPLRRLTDPCGSFKPVRGMSTAAKPAAAQPMAAAKPAAAAAATAAAGTGGGGAGGAAAATAAAKPHRVSHVASEGHSRVAASYSGFKALQFEIHMERVRMAKGAPDPYSAAGMAKALAYKPPPETVLVRFDHAPYDTKNAYTGVPKGHVVGADMVPAGAAVDIAAHVHDERGYKSQAATISFVDTSGMTAALAGMMKDWGAKMVVADGSKFDAVLFHHEAESVLRAQALADPKLEETATMTDGSDWTPDKDKMLHAATREHAEHFADKIAELGIDPGQKKFTNGERLLIWNMVQCEAITIGKGAGAVTGVVDNPH